MTSVGQATAGAAVAGPTGDAAALYAYADQLDAYASDALALAYDTEQCTTAAKDRAMWAGPAAEAYSAFCGGVAAALKTLPMCIQEVAAALRRHADVLSAVQAQVEGSASPDVSKTALATVVDSAVAEGRRVEKAQSGIARLWETTEPERKYLEGALTPFDIVAADHWIEALETVAAVPSQWLGEVDELIGKIGGLRADGESVVEELVAAARQTELIGRKLDAWLAFSPGWLKTAASSLSQIRGLSYGLSGLGVLADAGTMISPQDHGAMGWVDRGVAGVNGSLIAINMVTDEIPVVGEVTMVGTGVYLAGDYLYHHWRPFHNVCNDVGHTTVSVAKDVGHAAGSAWHSVTSAIGSLF